jgi:hypothetical protein
MTFFDKARQVLRGDAPREKARVIWAMRGSVDLPDDVLASIESLLEDRTLVQMDIPYRFGELRYLAADTLASIRARTGRLEPIVLADSFVPKSADKLGQMARAAGMTPLPAGSIEVCRALLDRGEIRRGEIVFDPREYLE